MSRLEEEGWWCPAVLGNCALDAGHWRPYGHSFLRRGRIPILGLLVARRTRATSVRKASTMHSSHPRTNTDPQVGILEPGGVGSRKGWTSSRSAVGTSFRCAMHRTRPTLRSIRGVFTSSFISDFRCRWPNIDLWRREEKHRPCAFLPSADRIAIIEWESSKLDVHTESRDVETRRSTEFRGSR